MIDIKIELVGKPEYTVGENIMIHQTVEIKQTGLVDLCANIFNILKGFHCQGFKISPSIVSNALNRLRPNLKLGTKYKKIYEASGDNLVIRIFCRQYFH